MATSITIKGLDRLRQNLTRLANGSLNALAGPMYRFAETHIAGPARDTYCPVSTGALRSSILVQLPEILGTRIVVTIGAGGVAAPYALAVHENPRAGKTGGFSPSGKPYYYNWSRVGEWKYLERPALEAVQNSSGLIQEVRAAMEGLAGGGA